MPTGVPALLRRLVDDAAVFPPGSAPLPEAIRGHAGHRGAWYAELVGPLLIPASAVADLIRLCAAPGVEAPATVGVIGDTGLGGLVEVVTAAAAAGMAVHQLEVAVAKRGEDPQPGLAILDRLLGGDLGEVTGYAELPLTFGLLSALDTVAGLRRRGIAIWPKFRTGGLAAELFPTPVELASVIVACRDRQLHFKLTAGLHHAVRHRDPQTGLMHHGFLNVLVASVAAAGGAEVDEVAEVLAGSDETALVEGAAVALDRDRPLWLGFGSCSISEPVTDLTGLGLLGQEHR